MPLNNDALMENILIGKREAFAIEIADYDPDCVEGRFQFWINNCQVGSLNVRDELKTCATAMEEIITSKNKLYDPAFIYKTDAEIFRYCLLLDIAPLQRTNNDYERFNSLRTYSPFFGEQFDEITKIIYYKNGCFHFL